MWSTQAPKGVGLEQNVNGQPATYTGESRGQAPENDYTPSGQDVNYYDDSSPRSGGGGGGSKQAEPFDLIGNALAASAQTLYERIAAGGDINEILSAAMQSFGDALGQGVMQMMAEAMPGPGGMLLGAIGGGLISRLFGGIFKKKGNKPDRTPIPVEVTNLPQLMQPWTLPSSHYFNPSGYNRGPFNQTINNNITVTASPKIASVIQRATTAPGYRRQLERANV